MNIKHKVHKCAFDKRKDVDSRENGRAPHQKKNEEFEPYIVSIFNHLLVRLEGEGVNVNFVPGPGKMWFFFVPLPKFPPGSAPERNIIGDGNVTNAWYRYKTKINQ